MSDTISDYMQQYKCPEGNLTTNSLIEDCPNPVRHILQYKGAWLDVGVYWCDEHYAKFFDMPGYNYIASIGV